MYDSVLKYTNKKSMNINFKLSFIVAVHMYISIFYVKTKTCSK